MAQTKVKLVSNGVITVDNLHASHGITTDHIGEGSVLYYTDARVQNYLTTNNYIKTTDVASLETTTSLSLAANILSYVDEAGNTTNLDLSLYLDDTNLARLVSGTLDGGTGIATFTRDDASTFTVDFSAFLSDANDYVTSASFNTADGVLTLTRLGGGTVTVDLDNRYLTSFTETDPVYTASSWYTTTNNSSNWDTAFGWGDHSLVGYLTAETDPIFSASAAAAITSTNITNWNTAYGWGNHASAGYLTSYSETDTLATVTARGGSTGEAVTFSSTSLQLSGHWYSGFHSATQNYIHLYPIGHSGAVSSTDIRAWNGTNADTLRITGGSNNITWRGNTLWNSGNDGAGSGLDADLLDGNHASAFALASHSHSWSSITTDTRTNYDLKFQPNAENYAGFQFLGQDGLNAGYLLIRSNTDNFTPYTANGITLVSDQGGLNFFARTGTQLVRMGTGTSETFRLESNYSLSLNSSRAPIFYDSNDTNWWIDPNSSSSAKFRQFVQIGDSSSYNTNSGTWGARLNVTDDVHAKIDVAQDANGMHSHWYAHTGQSSIKFGTTSSHGVEFVSNNQGRGQITSGGTLEWWNNISAPAYYDYNDTNYYVDPNGVTNISHLRINGNWSSYSSPYTAAFTIRGTYPSAQYRSTTSNSMWLYHMDGGGHIQHYYAPGVDTQDWSIKHTMQNDGTFISAGSSRAPIFYDSNNTGYYVDPNSNSKAVTFHLGNGSTFNSGSTYALQLSHNNRHLLALNYNNSANYPWLVNDTWNGGAALIVHFNGVGDRFFVNSGGHMQADGSSRAPIFYDSNNTSYYVDPASTSNLSGLTVANQISGSVSGSSNSIANTGYGNGNFTWKQDHQTFGPYSGWHNYLISNHGDGSNYYNTIIAMPFWGVPRYSRLEGGTQRGPYTFWSDENMDAPNKSGTSYYQTNTWMQFNGNYGLYWPNQYGAHFYPNNYNSYTQFRLNGSKGGYGGIVDSYSAVSGIMYDSSGNGGVYREANGRWYFYHHVGNNCTGINTSTTSSSYGLYVEKGIYSTGDITAYSDVRKKTNIATIDSALDKVTKLRGVYYDRIDDLEKGRQVGVIAQEVNDVLPEAVIYAEDVDEYGVKYGNIVGVLIEAIKEQQKQIEELKQLINK